MFFAPLTVGIHFSENNNLAISTRVFAPTGPYKGPNLASLGMAMNEWTIEPNLTHTFLWKKRGLEFDNYLGFDIYSRNTTTKYTSGNVFNWGGMIVQYFSERFGVGAVISNITQVTDDSRAPCRPVAWVQAQRLGRWPYRLVCRQDSKAGRDASVPVDRCIHCYQYGERQRPSIRPHARIVSGLRLASLPAYVSARNRLNLQRRRFHRCAEAGTRRLALTEATAFVA